MSKEILTNSLVALKAKPTEEKAAIVDETGDTVVKAARQKRSVSCFEDFNMYVRGGNKEK